MSYGTVLDEVKTETIDKTKKYAEGMRRIFDDEYRVSNTAKTVETGYQVGDRTYTETDIMPTSTTMQYQGMTKEELDADYRKDVIQESTEQKYKLSVLGKFLIAVYSAVIMGLFVLIVMNTQTLKVKTYAVDARQDVLYQLEQEVNTLESDLESLSSDEVILNKALEQGMVYAD